MRITSSRSTAQLRNIANAFVQLQEKRHTADYDNAFVWSRANAIAAIDTVRAAFSDWQAIRAQDAAQDYLLQLFLPRCQVPRSGSMPRLTSGSCSTNNSPGESDRLLCLTKRLTREACANRLALRTRILRSLFLFTARSLDGARYRASESAHPTAASALIR